MNVVGPFGSLLRVYGQLERKLITGRIYTEDVMSEVSLKIHAYSERDPISEKNDHLTLCMKGKKGKQQMIF